MVKVGETVNYNPFEAEDKAREKAASKDRKVEVGETIDYDPFEPEERSSDDRGEFSKGLEAGVHELKGIGYGLAGLVGSGLKKITPDVIELDAFGELTDWGLGRAHEEFEKAEAVPVKESDIFEIESAGEFGDWLTQTAGRVAPTLIGGGVSSIAGGVIKAGVKSTIKELAKAGVKDATKRQVKQLAKLGAKKVAKGVNPSVAESIAMRGIAEATRKGAIRGAAAGSIGMESGGTMHEIKEETGEEAPGTALVFGSAAGLLDVLPVTKVLDALGVGKLAKKGVGDVLKKTGDWKKVAKVLQKGRTIGGIVGTEMVTEGVQELINKAAVQWVDENQDFLAFDREDFKQALNAAAAGAVGGGIMGAIGAGGEGRMAKPEPGETVEEGEARKEDATREESEAELEAEMIAAEREIESISRAGELAAKQDSEGLSVEEQAELDGLNAEFIAAGEEPFGTGAFTEEETAARVETEGEVVPSEAVPEEVAPAVEAAPVTETVPVVEAAPIPEAAPLSKEPFAVGEAVEPVEDADILPAGKIEQVFPKEGLVRVEGKDGLFPAGKFRRVGAVEESLENVAEIGTTESEQLAKDTMASRPSEQGAVQTEESLRSSIVAQLNPGRVRRMEKSGLLRIINDPADKRAGAWDGSSMMLNAAHIRKQTDPFGILLHEGGEHAAMTDMLGDSYDALQASFDRIFESGDYSAKIASEKANKFASRPAHVPRERLAYFIQDAWAREQKGELKGQARSLFRRIVNKIKAWWRTSKLGREMAQAGIDFKLTDAYAVALAERGLAFAEERKRAGERLTPVPVGTPEIATAGVEQDELASQSDTILDGPEIGLTGLDVSRFAEGREKLNKEFEEKRRLYQDQFLPFKRFDTKAKEAAAARGETVPFMRRVYDMLDLVPTKTYNAVRDLKEQKINPMYDMLNKAGATQEDADEFVYARTVKEVNKDGRERMSLEYVMRLLKNLGQKDKVAMVKEMKEAKDNASSGKDGNFRTADYRKSILGILDRYIELEQESENGIQEIAQEWRYVRDRPSGMSDGHYHKEGSDDPLNGAPDETVDILDKWKDNSKMQAFGEMFDTMNRETPELLYQHGVIGAKERDAWLGNREHYATLRREGYEDSGASGLGHGMFVGKASLGMEFSPKRAVNVFTNTIQKTEIQIAKAFKNDAVNGLASAIKAYPEVYAGNFEVKGMEQAPYRDKHGFVRHGSTKQVGTNDLVFWQNGKKKLISASQDEETARLAMRSLNNADAEMVTGVAKISRWFGNWQRMVFVSLSPYFILRNIPRDFGTALYNIEATEDNAGARSAIVRGYTDSLKSLVRYEWKDDRTSEGAKKVKRFMDAGGRIGWIDAFKNVVDAAEDMKKTMREMQPGTFSYRKAKVRDFIEGLNSATENVVRLAAFNHLVKPESEGGAGKSDGEAARIVKDLTTNFTRKGQRTNQVDAWFLFANAAAQGIGQIAINTRANPRAFTKMFLGTMAAAFVLDQMNRALSEEDDEGDKIYDKVPGYVKENNIVIHNPASPDHYITIPAPWGFGWFWGLGRKASEAASSSMGDLPDFNVTKAAIDSIQHGAQSFMPIYSDSPVQLFLPTIIDPLYQMGANENAFGGKLYPEKFPGAIRAQSEMKFKNTPEYARSMAQVLNKLGRGDAAKSSAFDMPPEFIELAVSLFAGGNYQLGKDVIETSGLTRPEGVEAKKNKVPFVKVYSHEPTGSNERMMYHERVAEVLTLQKQLKHFTEGPYRDPAYAGKIRKENLGLARMLEYTKSTERRLRELRKAKRNAEARGLARRMETIDEAIQKVVERFNTKYRKIVLQ